MNNEPENTGTEAEWSMPEPIYRSSEGKDLKSTPNDPEDSRGTEHSQKEREITMENEQNDVAEATSDPQGENAVGKHERGDNISLSMTAVGLLALLIAGIAFLMVYFLFFRTGGQQLP